MVTTVSNPTRHGHGGRPRECDVFVVRACAIISESSAHAAILTFEPVDTHPVPFNSFVDILHGGKTEGPVGSLMTRVKRKTFPVLFLN